MKKNIKIRYSPEEMEIVKKKAEKLGKNIIDYQKEISKRANVKIEIK